MHTILLCTSRVKYSFIDKVNGPKFLWRNKEAISVCVFKIML